MNAAASIGHDDTHSMACLLYSNKHFAIAGRKLQRVGKQVEQHVFQLLSIELQLEVLLRLIVEQQLDAVGLGVRFEGRHQPAHQRVEGSRRFFQLQSLSLQLVHVQDFFNQAQQAVGVALDEFQRGKGTVVQARFFEHPFQGA